MTLEVAAVLRMFGLLRREDIPALAGDLLVQGQDTPTLRQLAGLTTADLGHAQELFAQVLQELDRPLPSATEAPAILARELANAVLVPGADVRALAADGARVAALCGYPAVLRPFYDADDDYGLPEFFSREGVDEVLIEYARHLINSAPKRDV